MLSRMLTRPRWTVALLLLAAAAPADLAAQEPLKIGIVNLDRVVLESAAGTDLRTRLETLQRDAQAEAQRLSQEANDLRNRITEGATTLSGDELSDLRERYEDKVIEIQRFQDDKQREADALQNQAMRQVEIELEPVFRRLREEEGYDLILNNVPGVVVMATPRVDITGMVIERLNAAKAAAGGG